jgi:hypothetical protein
MAKNLFSEAFNNYIELKNLHVKLAKNAIIDDIIEYERLDKLLVEQSHKLKTKFVANAKDMKYLEFEAHAGFLSEYGKIKDVDFLSVEDYEKLPTIHLIPYVEALENKIVKKQTQLVTVLDELEVKPDLENLKRNKRAISYTIDVMQYDLEQIDEALNNKINNNSEEKAGEEDAILEAI